MASSDLLEIPTNGPSGSGTGSEFMTDIAIIAEYFPREMAEKQKIAKGDCCQDRKFPRISHLHTAFCNQWTTAELFLLLSDKEN